MSGAGTPRCWWAAAIANAHAALRIRAEFGSLYSYFVSLVPQPPTRLPPTAEPGTIPITTPVSDALSKDLQKRGFKFVGSTIAYNGKP
ncbi:MAG: DNA-3-methyladenine glycosylase I [Chloroflexota bacterium]